MTQITHTHTLSHTKYLMSLIYKIEQSEGGRQWRALISVSDDNNFTCSLLAAQSGKEPGSLPSRGRG